MLVILSIALALNISIESPLLQKLTPISQAAHKKCLDYIPKASRHNSSASALICGADLNEVNLRENLNKTSLIHIFIVSGSHLIILDNLFQTLRIPFFIRFFILSFYSMAAQWAAPVVRALLSLLVHEIFQRKRLFLPPDLQTLTVGLFTLLLFPDWWNSRSLIMSWCASLALTTPACIAVKNPFRKIYLQQFSIYIIMAVPVWGFGSLHPLSIIFNIFLGNLIAFALFPLALMSLLHSHFLSLFEFSMDIFSITLKLISDPILIEKSYTLSIEQLWLWLFAFHICFHFIRIFFRRGKHI